MRQYEPHINQMFILLLIHLCDLIFGSMQSVTLTNNLQPILVLFTTVPMVLMTITHPTYLSMFVVDHKHLQPLVTVQSLEVGECHHCRWDSCRTSYVIVVHQKSWVFVISRRRHRSRKTSSFHCSLGPHIENNFVFWLIY